MLFKTRCAYTTSLSEGKNCKFLAINQEPICRDLGEKKTVAHRFTILRALSAGFASAPYKLKSPKRDPDAKPLSELKYGEDGKPYMAMWSFKKQGAPGNKGPRSDLCWSLQAGNTIKLWLDEERVKDTELLGADVGAFTVCEISVASKNEESVRNGWCIKITSVRPADFSLHSISEELTCLCSSIGEARARELLRVQAHPMLEKELETQSVAFWAPVKREAQLDESGTAVRLLNWGESYPIEISAETAMWATNCTRMDWAFALLEVAIGAGALSVLVVANDFWKGGPRAVPIVSASTLFEGIADAGIWPTAFKMCMENGSVGTLEVEVCGDKVAVPGAKPPSCDDFELAGLDTELADALPVQFNLRGGDATVPALWKGYLNVGATRGQPFVAKRRRLQTMDGA